MSAPCPNTEECGETVEPVVTEDDDRPHCPICGATVFNK